MSTFRTLVCVILITLLCSLVNGVQTPFVLIDRGVGVTHFGHIDNSNFTTMNLSDLELRDGFTIFSHPSFSNYQVRIKKTDFCDPTVK